MSYEGVHFGENRHHERNDAALPDIAGVVAPSIQIPAGAASSGLVAVLFDGRSALSMTAGMAACSLLALIVYCLPARHRRTFIGPFIDYSHSRSSPANSVALRASALATRAAMTAMASVCPLIALRPSSWKSIHP